MASSPIEIKFISSGSYGCVYDGYIGCDEPDESSNQNAYVTKIMKRNKYISFEIENTKKLYEIQNAYLYFAGFIQTCGANITKISSSEIEKCDLFEQNTTNEKTTNLYISAKIRYVGKQTLREYFYDENNSARRNERNILSCYHYLLHSIQKMNTEARMIHTDIKPENIMMDEKTKYPIIIDFGLMFPIDNILLYNKMLEPFVLDTTNPDFETQLKLEIENQKIDNIFNRTFYRYNNLDFYLLTRIYDNPDILKTECNAEEIKKYIDEFYEDFSGSKGLGGIMEKSKIDSYKEKQTEYYKTKYNGKKWINMCFDLTKEPVIQMWDKYALDISFLEISPNSFSSFEKELTENQQMPPSGA
jgi:serine/threonine protein kinase